MLQKYGPAQLSQRFMVMDTICDATQVGWNNTHRAGNVGQSAVSVQVMVFGINAAVSEANFP